MFESLQKRLGSVFSKLKGHGVLSETHVLKALEEISQAFIEADVAQSVILSFMEKVKTKAIGKEVLKSIQPGQMVIKIVHEELVEILGNENKTINLEGAAPVVLMMVGLQGSGKTTTSAKIAKRLTDRAHKKVLMASLDTHRPAAQEQLRQLGEQIHVPTLTIIEGQNPLTIAQRALHTAKMQGYDVLILDTAGRADIDASSMHEISEIKKITTPHEILLVADSLTGQNAVNLATGFDQQVNITGIVLTRMDSDARGGAALSMRAVTGKPIKLIGVGEKIDSLEDFHPKRMADRILDMGDIVSLVEKAAEKIDLAEAEILSKKIKAGKFDMNDLALQIQQLEKMGGIGQILSMMPGASKIQEKMVAGQFDDKSVRRQLAIISSMTPKEREAPEILKHSRKQRIASGSGTNAMEINKLLKMHRMMADVMKDKKGLPFMQNIFSKNSPLNPKAMMGGLLNNFNLNNMPKNMQSPFDFMQKYTKNQPNTELLEDLLQDKTLDKKGTNPLLKLTEINKKK